MSWLWHSYDHIRVRGGELQATIWFSVVVAFHLGQIIELRPKSYAAWGRGVCRDRAPWPGRPSLGITHYVESSSRTPSGAVGHSELWLRSVVFCS